MLFNSINFAIFLPVVFALYWLLAKRNLRLQNILLLISSYFFYACWDYRFLFLLIFSTLLDYFTGIKIYESKDQKLRLFWLSVSVIINLGFLGVFKYYNFFITSFSQGLTLLGIHTNFWTLNVILPVGISFYTFHGLSYILDLYRNRIKPEMDFIAYSVFVSFFPLLVAGPLERATHLLPQILEKREFNYLKAVDGLRQILWGLFKKIVIADNCAEYANGIFNNWSNYSGSTLAIGALFFAFQIYGDFSGYSDIALGTARLFGIELLQNFAFPYFSRDIAEFWRRWHISLSSWFRDYLYIPLGGSKGGTWMKIRNTFIIFLISGFWHGANWTFLAWGALNAVYFLPLLLFNRNRNNLEIVAKGQSFPTVKEILNIFLTFSLTTLAWIFFRSSSLEQAISYVSRIFSFSLFSVPAIRPTILFMLLFLFLIIEWIGREEKFAIAGLGLKWKRSARWGMYYVIFLMIYFFGHFSSTIEFIYFQF